MGGRARHLRPNPPPLPPLHPLRSLHSRHSTTDSRTALLNPPHLLRNQLRKPTLPRPARPNHRSLPLSWRRMSMLHLPLRQPRALKAIRAWLVRPLRSPLSDRTDRVDYHVTIRHRRSLLRYSPRRRSQLGPDILAIYPPILIGCRPCPTRHNLPPSINPSRLQLRGGGGRKARYLGESCSHNHSRRDNGLLRPTSSMSPWRP